jgi:hypothetical protein
VLIPIIAIFVTSLLAISHLYYQQMSKALTEKTQANLDIFTDNILNQIEHLEIILDTTKQILNDTHLSMARALMLTLETFPDDVSPEELRVFSEPLGILELTIANSDGIIIASNIAEYIGFDYNSTEPTKIYLQLADGTITELSEEPRESVEPIESDSEFHKKIRHYTGIARAGGGFVQVGFDAGVLGMLQEEINVRTTIRNSRIGENGYSMLLSDGFVIMHPNENFEQMFIGGVDFYRIVKSGEGYAWIDFMGQSYFCMYKNTNDYTIVGLVPEGDYYRERNLALRNAIILLVLSIFILGAVVYAIITRLFKPIGYLVEGLGKNGAR